jgi:tryptophanyl-tRNA synthetase
MKTVFSGIQPTGALHLGNYLGAIKGWGQLVNTQPANYIFSIVDLHSITIFQDPKVLRESILRTFATYLACGIDPDLNPNITVFLQSLVPAHTELAWILGCNTPLGWLDRMTQYKDKTSENKERACLGLYSYPVLMAADILLYNTDIVPVGEDQIQHIELTRDIAMRMNRLYERDIFTVPNYKLTEAKRVMSLRDGTKKMSKSDPSDATRINLTDMPDEIQAKIKRATTGEIESPEVQNLVQIYKYLTGNNPNLDSFASFKKTLSDALITEIEPIRAKILNFLNEKTELHYKLHNASQKALEIASKNINFIKSQIILDSVK